MENYPSCGKYSKGLINGFLGCDVVSHLEYLAEDHTGSIFM